VKCEALNRDETLKILNDKKAELVKGRAANRKKPSLFYVKNNQHLQPKITRYE